MKTQAKLISQDIRPYSPIDSDELNVIQKNNPNQTQMAGRRLSTPSEYEPSTSLDAIFLKNNQEISQISHNRDFKPFLKQTILKHLSSKPLKWILRTLRIPNFIAQVTLNVSITYGFLFFLAYIFHFIFGSEAFINPLGGLKGIFSQVIEPIILIIMAHLASSLIQAYLVNKPMQELYKSWGINLQESSKYNTEQNIAKIDKIIQTLYNLNTERDKEKCSEYQQFLYLANSLKENNLKKMKGEKNFVHSSLTSHMYETQIIVKKGIEKFITKNKISAISNIQNLIFISKE